MLLWAAVEDAAGGGVALEPGLADLEFAAALDCPYAVSTSGVFRHLLHHLPSEGRTVRLVCEDPHYVVEVAPVRVSVGSAAELAEPVFEQLGLKFQETAAALCGAFAGPGAATGLALWAELLMTGRARVAPHPSFLSAAVNLA